MRAAGATLACFRCRAGCGSTTSEREGEEGRPREGEQGRPQGGEEGRPREAKEERPCLQVGEELVEVDLAVTVGVRAAEHACDPRAVELLATRQHRLRHLPVAAIRKRSGSDQEAIRRRSRSDRKVRRRSTGPRGHRNTSRGHQEGHHKATTRAIEAPPRCAAAALQTRRCRARRRGACRVRTGRRVGRVGSSRSVRRRPPAPRAHKVALSAVEGGGGGFVMIAVAIPRLCSSCIGRQLDGSQAALDGSQLHSPAVRDRIAVRAPRWSP